VVILEDAKPEYEVRVFRRDAKGEEPVVLKRSDMGIPLAKPSADRILAAKAVAAEAEASAFGREIDELVNLLYGPAKEEIAVVRASAK
jgi:hypothetical protein